jgi:heat shock protein HslJ
MSRHRAVITRVIMAVAFAVLILGIGGGLLLTHASQSLPTTLTQHAWKLEAFTMSGHREVLLPGVSITLTFRAQQSQISGFSGCNFYGASYTLSHGQLHLDHFYQTLIACVSADVMQQEFNYMQALEQIATYEIGPTDRLTLRDDSGQVALQYSAVPLQGGA